ncbi:MAG: 6-bladed beta-propeller [Parabacteroides sp.]|nr:6-bladed beta-propeller [Parabacteroides sp.]MDD7562865.1 6-bladed beta-propeller [Parabacteroides sp.]MDY6255325.1 6-bladed beta-propeller [Bacteroidales bacterium]
MKTKVFFFVCMLLLVGSLILSCSSRQNEKSSVKQDEIKRDTLQIINLSDVSYKDSHAKLSDFAASITYIPLSDDKLIGDISQLCLSDNKFFIRCGTIIEVFTSEGAYIKPLFKKGNGPEETICLERFICNDEQKIITFPAFGDFLYSYDFDGNFIRRENNTINDRYKKIIGYQDFLRFYTLSAPTPVIGQSSNIYGDTLLYGENFENNQIIFSQENPCKEVKVTYNGIIAELENADFVTGKLDSCFWYRNLFMDTLYLFNKDKRQFLPKYAFNLGDHVWDLETYMHLYYMDKDYLNQLDSKTFLQELFLGKNMLVYKLKKSGKEGVGVYSLVEQKNITFSNNIFENDLDSYLKKIDLSQALLNGYCDGEFLYFPVQAYMFLEEGNKPFSSNITNDSNPIIVKVKLK